MKKKNTVTTDSGKHIKLDFTRDPESLKKQQEIEQLDMGDFMDTVFGKSTPDLEQTATAKIKSPAADDLGKTKTARKKRAYPTKTYSEGNSKKPMKKKITSEHDVYKELHGVTVSIVTLESKEKKIESNLKKRIEKIRKEMEKQISKAEKEAMKELNGLKTKAGKTKKQLLAMKEKLQKKLKK